MGLPHKTGFEHRSKPKTQLCMKGRHALLNPFSLGFQVMKSTINWIAEH